MMSNGLQKLGLIFSLTVITALVTGFGVYTAEAQLASNIGQVSTLSASSKDLPVGYVRDVIYGNKTRGPYHLSWKGVPASRESVIIDSRKAVRGVDYLIDYDKGQLSFASNLAQSSLAIVEYPLDPDKSTRNTQGLNIPLALDIYSSDRASLQFTTLYRQTDPSGAQSGEAIFGLAGGTQINDRTKVTTSMYLSPSGGGQDAGTLDRAAGRIGAETTLAPGLNLSGSYVRAGDAFAGSKDYGFKSGQDVQDLALAWRPEGGRMAFDSSYQRLNIDDPQGDNVATTMRHQLSYNLSPATQMLFTRHSLERDLHSSGSTQVTDTLQVKQTLGDRTHAQYTMTDISKETGDQAVDVTTHLLTVDSKLQPNLDVRAGIKREESSAAGESSALDMDLKARILQRMEVQAQFAGRDSDASGSDNLGAVRVAAVPSDRLRVSAGISDRQTQTAGIRSRDIRLDSQPLNFLSLSGGYAFTNSGSSETVIRDIHAKAKPLDIFSLEGMYRNRDFGSEDINTSELSVSVNPFQFLGITAGMAQNPEDDKGRIQHFDTRTLGVKANVGVLSFTGSYSYKDEYLVNRDWMQTKLGMGLRLAQATHLTGGYEYSEAGGATGMSTRRISMGLRRDLGSDFNLMVSGARIERESGASMDTAYEAELRLGVRF